MAKQGTLLPLLRADKNEFTDDWSYVKRIGQGGEGETSLWERRGQAGRQGVLKTIHCRGEGKLAAERKILKKIMEWRPERIVKLMHTYTDLPRYGDTMLLTEVCRNDLHTHKEIETRAGRPLPESYIWRIFKELIEAVAFLHHGYPMCLEWETAKQRQWRPILHLDIKPANILLKPDPEYPDDPWRDHVKLADFGMSTAYESEILFCQGGTPEYQPPECRTDRCATRAADMWAVGSVIHMLVHYMEPLELGALMRGVPARKIQKYPYPATRPLDDQPFRKAYSAALNESMMKCLSLYRLDRPTALQLIGDFKKREGHERGRPQPHREESSGRLINKGAVSPHKIPRGASYMRSDRTRTSSVEEAYRARYPSSTGDSYVPPSPRGDRDRSPAPRREYDSHSRQASPAFSKYSSRHGSPAAVYGLYFPTDRAD